MSIENCINETFTRISDARKYIIDKGFNLFTETFVNMGEGFEHIFTWDYKHKYDNTICRMCDLRWAQRKVKNTDRIPQLIGFIQVSIKEITTSEHI